MHDPAEIAWPASREALMDSDGCYFATSRTRPPPSYQDEKGNGSGRELRRPAKSARPCTGDWALKFDDEEKSVSPFVRPEAVAASSE